MTAICLLIGVGVAIAADCCTVPDQGGVTSPKQAPPL